MYIVAITGASGSILGVRIIEELLRAERPVSAMVSDAGWDTMQYELKVKARPQSMGALLRGRGFEYDAGLLAEYNSHDLFAPPASGTARYEAMVIAPLSMKSLAAIAHGYADSLITRAADVALKEARPLVLVPRETPLSSIHLENMLKVKNAGAHVVPPMPGFYTFPQTVDDVVDFVVGKVLNLLGIEHDLFRPWGE